MQHSARYFENQVHKAQKQKSMEPKFDDHAFLLESFCRTASLPDAMSAEIYEEFAPDYDKLYVILEVFHHDADETARPALVLKEWHFLVETTNRYADEMDLKNVQRFYEFFMKLNVLPRVGKSSIIATDVDDGGDDGE